MSKLKDICYDMHQGINTVADKVEYYETGYPIIQSKNITKGFLDLEDVRYVDEKTYNYYKEKYNPQEDDVLLANIGTIGKSIIIKEKNNFLIAWNIFLIKINKEKMNPKYLKVFFDYLFWTKYYDKFLTGGTVKFINKKTMGEIEVPNIKIEEQQRIANEIEEVQDIIQLKQLQLEKLDELIKSQFVEMFGDIENTQYDVMKLQELSNLITDGEHKKPNYTDEGKPFISVVNITTGELKFDNCKFVSEEDTLKFQKRCKPEKNDILYTKVGATYGRSAIVNTDKDFSLYVSVCLIKPKNNLINPIFLNYTLRQPYVKTQADKCIKGIGVPDLHLIEIKNFNIIVPPIELQNKFAEFVKQIDKQKFEIQKSLDEIQELYESLMDKYFG